MDIKCFLLVQTNKTKKDDIAERRVYQRADTGEEMCLKDAPIGAIWRCEWLENDPEYSGIDGKSYTVKTPGGDWLIDDRASNCDMKSDKIHKCWCRHGEAPNFTVNKVGNTCNAGSGSIKMGSYHGFLTNGELTNC